MRYTIYRVIIKIILCLLITHGLSNIIFACIYGLKTITNLEYVFDMIMNIALKLSLWVVLWIFISYMCEFIDEHEEKKNNS